MKKIKYTIITIVTILFCAWMWLPNPKFQNTSHLSQNNNFSIEISLPKDSFVIAESIFLTIKIKNNSGFIDSIALCNYDEVSARIKVKDNNNKESEYKGAYISYIRNRYRIFKPFEEVEFVVDVLVHYGNNRLVQNIVGFYNYFPVGRYTLKSEFDNDLTDEMNNLNLISNELTFTIIEEQEDLAVYEKLRDIYSKSILDGNEKKRSSIYSLLDLLGKYPNYTYYNQAYKDLNIYLKKYNMSLLDKSSDYINIIKKYPNSPYVKTAVLLYVDGMIKANNIKAVDVLNELVENNHGTKIAEIAEKLKQIKQFK